MREANTLTYITSERMKGSQKKHRETRQQHTDIDGGYAWFVLAGCFIMYTFLIGSVKAYGVLYTEMVDYFSSGYGNAAWIGAIASFLRLTLGPIANLLSRTYSFRIVTFFGGLMLGLGYMTSGLVTKMDYLYLTFSCCGLGYGLTFAPCSTIVSFYFEKHRALANGITASGSGIGALTLPFLYKALIENYGLKGTFWITGAIFCNICVAACLFRQPKILTEAKLQRQKEGIVDSDQMFEERQELLTRTRSCPCIDMRFSLFRNPLFTMNVVSFALCMFSYFGNFILIPSQVKALGYNNNLVALSVTIFGAVEVVARIMIGWFADQKKIQTKYIYVICMFIGGTFSFFVPLFDSFTSMAIYSAVIAMFPGSLFCLMSPMTIEVVGLRQFTPALGLIYFSMAFGSTPSQPLLGWIKDYHGNWNPSFMLSGGIFILAGIVILLEPVVVRLCNKLEHTENDDTPIN